MSSSSDEEEEEEIFLTIDRSPFLHGLLFAAAIAFLPLPSPNNRFPFLGMFGSLFITTVGFIAITDSLAVVAVVVVVAAAAKSMSIASAVSFDKETRCSELRVMALVSSGC